MAILHFARRMCARIPERFPVRSSASVARALSASARRTTASSKRLRSAAAAGGAAATALAVAAAYLWPVAFAEEQTPVQDSDDGDARLADPRRRAAAVQQLREALGEDKVVSDHDTTAAFTTDYSYHTAQPPDAVVYAECAEDVATVLRVCDRERVPVVPFGGGTSLEGHVVATHGGIVLHMGRMDKIIAIRPRDLDVTVQPGVRWEDLNEALRPHGMFLGVDPGPGATVGGMMGTCCSGTLAVRHGTMKSRILSAEVVLPGGATIRTGQRAPKSSAGFDLTGLLTGSEGTLGVATEITLRLVPLPKYREVTLVQFASIHDAAQCVSELMVEGVGVARAELLGASMAEAVALAPAPTLLLESAAASEQENASHGAAIDRTLQKYAVLQYERSSDARRMEELWSARKTALLAAAALRPSGRVLITDTCVPRSAFPRAVAEAERDARDKRLTAPLVAHAGDGNFHFFVVFDPDDRDEVARVHAFTAALSERAIELHGTCTGEHGIGIGKRAYLPKELGGAAVAIMREIKRVFDPHGIMNPGKIFLDAAAAAPPPPAERTAG